MKFTNGSVVCVMRKYESIIFISYGIEEIGDSPVNTAEEINQEACFNGYNKKKYISIYPFNLNKNILIFKRLKNLMGASLVYLNEPNKEVE